MEEKKDLSRTLQHRTGVVPRSTLQHGTGKTSEIGESVDTHLMNTRSRIRKDFRLAIASIMKAAPSSDDSKAGLSIPEIVDDVLGALLNFTDCDTVAECILNIESLTTDLHERMTRDI